MSEASFALFDTAIGRCAIVWRGEAVIGAALSEASDAELRASVARRFPDAEERLPSESIEAAIDCIRGSMDGEPREFDDIVVDLSAAAPFERKVYEAARSIPRGEVRTYGEIAEAIGSPGAARAVGRALGRNPVPIIIPCHRVLAASGGSGGFSAPGGTTTKFRILEIEGASRDRTPRLFDALPMAVRPAQPPTHRPSRVR